MILTNTKAAELGIAVSSGVHTETMFIDPDKSDSGNYWVDWASAFVTLCTTKLGLEVETGPGTSIGIIHNTYGPIRYQYDCDWNEKDGRVNKYPENEKGFTLWEDIPVWDTIFPKSDPNDENSSRVGDGIDRENRRFDFILWLTAPSTDPNREGESLGLRFKYPITNERGYRTVYQISKTPAIMIWYKSDPNKVYAENITMPSTRERLERATNNILDRTLYINGGIGVTKTWTTEKNYNWKHYSEYDEETRLENQEESYTTLGGNFTTVYPKSFSGYHKFQYIVSKTIDTIEIKLEKQTTNAEILLDILYGNFAKEKVSVDDSNTTIDMVNSFVMLANNNMTNGLSSFANVYFSEKNWAFNPSKMVNRPTSQSALAKNHWAISRVLMPSQTTHCKDLYQIFSFADLLNTADFSYKTFVDKDNMDHTFVLFNFGRGTSTTARSNNIGLAIPI